MNALDLKVPPVALLLGTASLMGAVAKILPSGQFPAPVWLPIPFAAAGATISALGVAAFRRARTTVNPTKPGKTSSLVHSGIYSLTRNPMYLGFLLLLCAWAILLSNAFALPFLAIFVLYINRFQIQPEERALTATFGAMFTGYAKHVRRWI